MIKIKIDKSKSNEPIFKLGFKQLDEKENRFLKRALIDGKEIKGISIRTSFKIFFTDY